MNWAPNTFKSSSIRYDICSSFVIAFTDDMEVRKRHEIFPISTGEAYKWNQPTSMAHIGV